MESFFISLNAIMPMFLFLCFGFALKTFKFAKESFLKELNTFLFNAFFPVLTFYNVYNIDLSESVNLKVLGLSFFLLVAAAALFIIIVPRFIKENPIRGVFIQACYRSNFMLFGLALAGFVYGESNLAIISVSLAVIVPTLNILAVITLERFSENKVGLLSTIKSICKNPLIIGVTLGFIYNSLPINTPAFLHKSIKDVASIATPLAIIVLGGTLTFSSIRNNLKYLVPGIFIKLVALPVLAVFIGIFMGLRGIELFTILSVFASPVSASSYAMSQSMGGDVELAGQFVALSTAASLITMFMFIFVLNTLGMI